LFGRDLMKHENVDVTGKGEIFMAWKQ
jgi:hypothetical protein